MHLFKSNSENYIKYNLSSSEKSAVAQFRFGILPLNIEMGDCEIKLSLKDSCFLCEFNEIEDESHSLLSHGIQFLGSCTLQNACPCQSFGLLKASVHTYMLIP